ncbi:uncharacterized protein METZ01_LOCUS224728, partial [marine metagenome]
MLDLDMQSHHNNDRFAKVLYRFSIVNETIYQPP